MANSANAVQHKGHSSTMKEILRIPNSSINILDRIGVGGFGSVMRGRVSMSDHHEFNGLVAIKRIDVPEEDKRTEFFTEVLNLNRFCHPNIVRLLGVSIDGPDRLMVLEYMDQGSLLGFLRNNLLLLPIRILLHISCQIASGLVHVAEKDYVHGDLAARNILIDSNLKVKLCDFGLARRVHKDQRYNLPIKGCPPIEWLSPEWLSPECLLRDKKFTKQSDVWSFGVVLWEVFSFGEIPYEGIPIEMIMVFIKCGGLLLKPVCCPHHVFKVISSCWELDPVDRITIEKAAEELQFLEIAFMNV